MAIALLALIFAIWIVGGVVRLRRHYDALSRDFVPLTDWRWSQMEAATVMWFWPFLPESDE